MLRLHDNPCDPLSIAYNVNVVIYVLVDKVLPIHVGIVYNVSVVYTTMARPNKNEAIAIAKRNKELFKMRKYPQDYLCAYFNLSKGRISQILKKGEEEGGGDG